MTNKRKSRAKDRRQNRTIPASAMKAWRAEMGLSERDAADRLGMSRTFLNNCEDTGAPLYVGLAMAALAAGLEPYSPSNNAKLRQIASVGDLAGVQLLKS